MSVLSLDCKEEAKRVMRKEEEAIEPYKRKFDHEICPKKCKKEERGQRTFFFDQRTRKRNLLFRLLALIEVLRDPSAETSCVLFLVLCYRFRFLQESIIRLSHE
jgi:hypothetical protein